jgi:ArsR family transcriptional regulator, arsenate/arsenite/antimonite-responsive transcriptional repressor / arsenate reductase (thioredoxin)
VLSALADPARLALVDALALGDRAPGELAATLGVASNLLAHHLHVLEDAGLVVRSRSEADRRRSYVHLVPEALDGVLPGAHAVCAPRIVFVCTANSARSQLAEAVWREASDVPVASGGTHPAERVHPGAVAAARRHGLRLTGARPHHVDDVVAPGDLLVSVCDSADAELSRSGARHVHWSIPDPVTRGTDDAFDSALGAVTARVQHLAPTVQTLRSPA